MEARKLARDLGGETEENLKLALAMVMDTEKNELEIAKIGLKKFELAQKQVHHEQGVKMEAAKFVQQEELHAERQEVDEHHHGERQGMDERQHKERQGMDERHHREKQDLEKQQVEERKKEASETMQCNHQLAIFAFYTLAFLLIFADYHVREIVAAPCPFLEQFSPFGFSSSHFTVSAGWLGWIYRRFPTDYLSCLFSAAWLFFLLAGFSILRHFTPECLKAVLHLIAASGILAFGYSKIGLDNFGWRVGGCTIVLVSFGVAFGWTMFAFKKKFGDSKTAADMKAGRTEFEKRNRILKRLEVLGLVSLIAWAFGWGA